jgi:hypothetical protein
VRRRPRSLDDVHQQRYGGPHNGGSGVLRADGEVHPGWHGVHGFSLGGGMAPALKWDDRGRHWHWGEGCAAGKWVVAVDAGIVWVS